MTDPTDAARILSVLVRSDEEAIAYFAARTQVARGVPTEHLRWWQGFLLDLVERLERADVEGLQAFREMLESAAAYEPAASSPSMSEDSPSPANPRVLPEPFLGSPPGSGPLVPMSRKEASPWVARAAFAPLPETDVADESLDETAALDLSKFSMPEPATPFREGSTELPHPSMEDGDFAGETAAIDAETIADALAAFPLPTKLPMTIERYAALVARSPAASEAELAELHREYAVADAAHRKRIDQEFSEAMSRDAPLRQQFADYLRQWRDWLRRQPKG